jgi:hypothetical protein
MKYSIVVFLLVLLFCFNLIVCSVHVSVNVNENVPIHRIKHHIKQHHNNNNKETSVVNQSKPVQSEADFDAAGSTFTDLKNKVFNAMKPIPMFSYFKVMMDGKPFNDFELFPNGARIPFSKPYEVIDFYVLCQDPDDLVELYRYSSGLDKNAPAKVTNPVWSRYFEPNRDKPGLPAEHAPADKIPAGIDPKSWFIQVVKSSDGFGDYYLHNTQFTFRCRAQIGTAAKLGLVVVAPSPKKKNK